MRKGVKMGKMTKEEFILKSIKKHGNKFDYSKSDYVGSKNPLKIICPIHGVFYKRPDKHLQGQGCQKCGFEERNKSNSETFKKMYRNRRPEIHVKDMPIGSSVIPLGINGDYAIIDQSDHDLISNYNWSITSNGYAFSTIVGYMHRFILSPKENEFIDHINHNKLDNRRANMRICNNQENSWNMIPKKGTSKYKGVSWNKQEKKWCAQIRIKGLQTKIGFFEDEIEAAKSYDKAAKKHFGEFAYLNFKDND